MSPAENGPEHRAAVVAGIRALADFIEQHTDLPVPQGVNAQYSVLGESPYVEIVRDAARVLGVEPLIDDDSASVHHVLASGGYPSPPPYFRVTYTVHGNTALADDQPEADETT
jgi:hypothetical protein